MNSFYKTPEKIINIADDSFFFHNEPIKNPGHKDPSLGYPQRGFALLDLH